VRTHYIIQDAAAHMPGSLKFGRYRRIAVLEVERGFETVAMISTHARGVVRVVETWERLNCGRTERDAYSRALRKAEALVADLEERDRRHAHAIIREFHSKREEP